MKRILLVVFGLFLFTSYSVGQGHQEPMELMGSNDTPFGSDCLTQAENRHHFLTFWPKSKANVVFEFTIQGRYAGNRATTVEIVGVTKAGQTKTVALLTEPTIRRGSDDLVLMSITSKALPNFEKYRAYFSGHIHPGGIFWKATSVPAKKKRQR